MEQTDQQVGRGHGRADQLQILDRIQQKVGTVPVFAFIRIEDIGSLKQATLARSAFAAHLR